MLTKSPIESELDDEILSLLKKLKDTTKDSKEYAEIIERASALHKLKVEERPKRLSKDTVLVVAANIFGILWLARYERENVISGRAFGNIMRLP